MANSFMGQLPLLGEDMVVLQDGLLNLVGCGQDLLTVSHMRITSLIFEVIINIPTPEPSWQAEDQKDEIR